MSRSVTLLALLVAATLTGCATVGAASQDDRTVVTVEEFNMSKADAYARFRRWAAQTYNSANSVIQMDDPNSGTLVLKGAETISRMALVTFPMGYTMTMDIRDNRVRFTQVVGVPLDSKIGGTTGGDAAKMRDHFATLRASAMASLTRTDDF